MGRASRRVSATAAANGRRALAIDAGKVERVRALLAELETAFGQIERENLSRWRDSAVDDVQGREMAYHEHRALQRVRRILSNVLRAEQLEQSDG